MKISDFKPGRRVHAGDNFKFPICDGILSKDLSICCYEDRHSKLRYYVRGWIIKINGDRSSWPLSMINYHRWK